MENKVLDTYEQTKAPEGMKEKELRKYLCEIATPKICELCKSQCAYGREWARRMLHRKCDAVFSIRANQVMLEVINFPGTKVHTLRVTADRLEGGAGTDVAYFVSPRIAMKFAEIMAQMLSQGDDDSVDVD